MPNDRFHTSYFDDSTLLKLQIFRGYIREWLPVFLKRPTFPEVHIFDFFSGPGTDAAGRPGSPIIIFDELRECIEQLSIPTGPGVGIHLHFNDSSQDKIDALRSLIGTRNQKPVCDVS